MSTYTPRRADVIVNAVAVAVMWPPAAYVIATEAWDVHGMLNRLVCLTACVVPLPVLLASRALSLPAEGSR